MADNIWNAGQRSAMTRAMSTQFAAHAADQGRFTEGWNYLPLMLIAAREFKQKLDEGEAAFDAAKARYGFGQFTFAEARTWSPVTRGNDPGHWWRTRSSPGATSAMTGACSAGTTVRALTHNFRHCSRCWSRRLPLRSSTPLTISAAGTVPVDGVSTWPAVRPTVY